MAFGETVPADEEARFRGYAEEIAAIQKARAVASGEAKRVAHVKQHIGTVGELVVTAAEAARVGVFAEAGKVWPVYVRFSNGSGLHSNDKAPDARGFALKLVGVPGKKLIEGLENEVTQDFLLINTAALPVRDPEEFMKLLRAAKDGPAKLLPRLVRSMGLGRALGILFKVATGKKVQSFATHSFNTAAPIAFGSTAAKLGLFPLDADPNGPSVSGSDYLRHDLVARLRAGPLRWTLRAQRFVDQASTPIEDTTVEWSGPWVDLGTLTLAKQDAESTRGKEISELVNRLSFDPWHAIEAHRPLGAVMRARRAAYAPSVIGRKAAPEPHDVMSI
ncbi:MAG TPA: catalase [Polyangiaceae bacterium]